MIEDFVRLPWNFRWCLNCVSSDTSSIFVRIGNFFLWFLHVPLLCLIKILKKWCNFKKTCVYFWIVWAHTQLTSLEEGPKYRSLKGLKNCHWFFIILTISSWTKRSIKPNHWFFQTTVLQTNIEIFRMVKMIVKVVRFGWNFRSC